ncbi:MAG TPA: hypothetical protein VGK67_22600 [Myxococcales bacterium]|jgi:hypothetical protein
MSSLAFLTSLLVLAGPWPVSTVDGSGHPGQHTSVAVDAQGRVHVAWCDFTAPTKRQLRYTQSTETGEWASEIVDASADVGGGASLALDKSGEPAISYFDFSHQSLKLARRKAGAWQLEVVDGAESVGIDSSLAVDQRGRLHVSYYDLSNRSLKYARQDAAGGTWALETVDVDGEVGKDSSLALDAQGRPHIAYLDEGRRQLRYARWTGSRWNLETVDLAGHVGFGASLVLDGQGMAAIAYWDFGKERLKFARQSAARGWTFQTVVSGSPGSRAALARDESDRLHLAFFRPGLGVNHAVLGLDGRWGVESIPEAPTTGYEASLALDPRGAPVLVFVDRDARRVLQARPAPGPSFAARTP